MKQDINESLGIKEKESIKATPKKYIAVEVVIGVLKMLFWIALTVFYLGLFVVAAEFNADSLFIITGLTALVFFVISYAVIQLLEVFVDVAKNTNQTNLLLKKQLDNKA